MKRLVLIFGILMGILISSCQKRKYPKEDIVNGSEDIFMDAQFGDEFIALKVGKDDYYCYSSFEQGQDSIYLFKSELRKFGCEDCPQTLQIELSDIDKRAIGASVPVELALGKGFRGFNSESGNVSSLKFLSHSNKIISSVHWNIKNGNSTMDSVTKIEFGQLGQQTVSLTVKTLNGCESMVINKLFAGQNGLFACSFSAEATNNNIGSFSANLIGGKAPYRYFWNFGDGSSNTLATLSHTYPIAGSYPVKLIVQDANNNICESNCVFVTSNDNSSCALNMSLSDLVSTDASLRGVKVSWKDANNKLFTSEKVFQTQESFFEILSSEPYDPNEKGESGRLLKVRFKILLSDGNEQKWMKSENAAIVVSYK